MLGWVLPSPAWATTGISTSCLVGDGRDRVEEVGQQRAPGRRRPRAAAPPRRSRAGNDARRACTNISPSSASSVTNTSAPCASQAACMTVISSLRAAPGASDWAISSAPAVAVEAHRLVVLDGVDARPVHQLEHRRPHHGAHAPPRRRQRRTDAKLATSVDVADWAGTSRRIARVTMPRVPSLPTKSLSREQPGDVLDPLAAERDEGAVGEHDVEAEDVVGGDAVLHAAQPAGVGGHVAADRADLEGRRVGRVPEPVLARPRAFTSALKAPGSTTATWQPGSISIARIRSRLSTMPPSTALAPPDSPLPGPARHDRYAVPAPPSAPRPAPARRPRRAPPPPACRPTVARPVVAVLLHPRRGRSPRPRRAARRPGRPGALPKS